MHVCSDFLVQRSKVKITGSTNLGQEVRHRRGADCHVVFKLGANVALTKQHIHKIFTANKSKFKVTTTMCLCQGNLLSVCVLRQNPQGMRNRWYLFKSKRSAVKVTRSTYRCRSACDVWFIREQTEDWRVQGYTNFILEMSTHSSWHE